MPIRILAPHEAAKIAAGEVIERPASVVKELVENSLDAGATAISVEVREGGLALIRVADNGCGIDPGELRLAFERHATSKVAGEDDLWRIATLGFRGEALPSIAAAGEVEVLSRTAGNDAGARIRLRDGEIADEGAGATPPGTMFTVRRLFSLQPARLKFLRSPGSEATQVSAVVQHYAMAYPEVRFELSIDGRTTLQTSGRGSLVDCVSAVYGADVAGAAIAVEAEADGIVVRGIAAEPRVHRSSRNYIGLYVNRRWVRNRQLTFAVEEAYTGMLPVGRRPIAVLDIALPPDEVDVNVHPTKAEVRLRREREVFGVLQRAVRRALSSNGVVPQAWGGLWAPPAERVPGFLSQQPTQGSLARTSPSRGGGTAPDPLSTGWRGGVPDEHLGVGAEQSSSVATTVRRLPMLRAVGQVAGMYVVAEAPDGMYLVDQHAGHERVMYEGFLASVRAGMPDVQGLLSPLTLELPAAHRALVAEHVASLAAMGFEIEHFGDSVYVVRAVPASIGGEDIELRITELLDRMRSDESAGGEAAHRVAASLACHASVRAGMSLAPDEQRQLLQSLESCESPRTCPHGRPTMVHLSADAIAREFRRR